MGSTRSDHELITFKALTPQVNDLTIDNHVPSLPSRLNKKKADWKLFQMELQVKEELFQNLLENAIQSKDYDQIASLLQQILENATLISIPSMKISIRSKPWWITELTQLRMRLHRIRRCFKKHPNLWSPDDARAARN